MKKRLYKFFNRVQTSKPVRFTGLLIIYLWSRWLPFPSELDKPVDFSKTPSAESIRNMAKNTANIKSNENQSVTDNQSQMIFVTGSGDQITRDGQRIAGNVNSLRGGESLGNPSSSSIVQAPPSSPKSKGVKGETGSSTGSLGIPGATGFPNPARKNARSINGAGSNNPKKRDRLPSGFYKSNPSSGSGNGNGNSPGNSAEYDEYCAPKTRVEPGDEYYDYFPRSRTRRPGVSMSKVPGAKRRVKRQRVYDRYQELLKKMAEKGYPDYESMECSLQRFEDLCVDPKIQLFTEKAILQAEGGLHLELDGSVKNIRVNQNLEVDIDLMCELGKTGETIYLDHKFLPDYVTLTRDNGELVYPDPSYRPDIYKRAYKSGIRAAEQQQKWAEKANGVKIYEAYDLRKYSDPEVVNDLIHQFSQGVIAQDGDLATIIFITNKDKE